MPRRSKKSDQLAGGRLPLQSDPSTAHRAVSRSPAFNPSQQEAIDHGTGPCAILSVAGSGKTTVLVHRIARLVMEVPPDQIVGVTFTKKAAGEMVDRLARLTPFGERVMLKTFHALAYLILKEGTGETPNILTPGQQLKMMREVAQQNGILEDARALLRGVSWFANGGDVPETLMGLFGVPTQTLRVAHEAYQAAKDQQRVMDFDDLLVKALGLMEGGLATTLRKRWSYFLVDEFQDTNAVQMRMLELLCPPETAPNLMVVGDDDQSIYSWRCAKPEFLIEFEKHWPGARVIKMQDNYRCSKRIVAIANRLIHFNKIRVAKRLKANLPRGVEVVLRHPKDPSEEASTVADVLRASHDQGRAWGDHAILYRTNAQSGPLEERFVQARIPYRLVGGVGFWGRQEVMDMLAYARVVLDPKDDESLERIFNVPNRFLGRAAMMELSSHAARKQLSLRASLSTTPWSRVFMRKGATQLHLDLLILERQANLPAGEFLRKVAAVVGMREYLAKQGEGEPDESRWQNIETLCLLGDRHTNLSDMLFHAANMRRQSKAEPDEAVWLMTLHRAKGLEWPVVFMVGVSHGLLPHARAENVEEERRLAYVGMTRAREELHISSVLNSYRRAAGPSIFLSEAGLGEAHEEHHGDSAGLPGAGGLQVPGGGVDGGPSEADGRGQGGQAADPS